MRDYIDTNKVETNNDEILQKCVNYWGESTVVYGPVWPIICSAITLLSCGNLNLALFLFKILFVTLHMLNCYLIFKISKSKKMVLLYGLNPFILFEGIGHVHNDLLVVTFVLASLFFLVKKKNIFATIVMLALSAAIKYFTILLLPFIIIYYFRKEEPLKRLEKCFKYGTLFIAIISVFYLIFFKDFEILKGVFTQQSKIAKSVYLLLYIYGFRNIKVINSVLIYIFILFFVIMCINILTKKNIKFNQIIKKYNIVILIFLFGLITNFQPWYIMWLFPTIMWQHSVMRKEIIAIAILSQFANFAFMIYGEGYMIGGIFICIVLVGSVLIYIINSIIENKRKGINGIGQISFNRWK